MRVLVTGSAGAIGRAVCARLMASGHEVVGLDLRPTDGVTRSVVGDVASRAVWDDALAGCGAVVHLAAALEFDEYDFVRDQVPANVVGVYHMFEACTALGVKRIVLASTVQVAGAFFKKGMPLLRVADGTWPYNTYGCTKVFLEEMGKMYARNEQMTVIAARIAYLPRDVETARGMSARGRRIYLSHDDAGRFLERAVVAEGEKLVAGSFHAMYVTSRIPEGGILDLTEAREVLGWEPADVYPAGLPFAV